MEEWYLRDVITKYWKQLKSKALIMLGEGNAGKTPIAEVIAMAIAEFWAEQMGPGAPEPCYRLTSDIDFLRGVVGIKCQVDVVDDADSDQIPIKKMKAVTDVWEVASRP